MKFRSRKERISNILNLIHDDYSINEIQLKIKNTEWGLRRKDIVNLVREQRLEPHLLKFEEIFTRGLIKPKTFKKITEGMKKAYKKGNFKEIEKTYNKFFRSDGSYTFKPTP